MPADDAIRGRLAANLAAVRGRVAEACRRAGRDAASVRLVAVTKYVDAALTRLVHDAGCHDLAESRPQALWAKAEALAGLVPPPRWHLVGHLQRNKLRRTLPRLALLHSLDSLRLLDALEEEAAGLGLVCRTLVEVNLTDDAGRTGVPPAEAETLVAAAAVRPHVEVCGLMGMARVPDGDTDSARRDFARLRELRDGLARSAGAGALAELSMGMSGDFEAAILEGATIVRVGSALFEGVVAA
ncbi:MAG: YggS family pyridoxal phosphate-dependent enzyme [Planctomycetaceae bacterium]